MKGNAAERGRVLIVDGYNVINVRKPVRESRGLEDARRALTDRLHDYAGWSGQRIVLVYDAWLSDRAQRSVEKRGSLEVVFTKKGETADQYIERLCDELADDVEMRRIELRVATSDLVEQTIAFGRGATRLSSRELLMEMDGANAQRGARFASPGPRGTTVAERLPPEILEKLERMRRGEEAPRSVALPPSPVHSAPKPRPGPHAPESERGEPAPSSNQCGPVTKQENSKSALEANQRSPATKQKRGKPASETNHRGSATEREHGKPVSGSNRRGSATGQECGEPAPGPNRRGTAIEPEPKLEPKSNQGKAKSRLNKNRTRRKPKSNQVPTKQETKVDAVPTLASSKPTGERKNDRSVPRQITPGTPPQNRKDVRH